MKRDHFSLPVIILTASENPSDARRAIDHGAAGYVPKSATGSVMLSALRLVLAGSIYVPPMLLAEAGASGQKTEAESGAEPLTPRQREVLHLLSRGLTNREICNVLGISEGTVKTHVSAIYEALDVSNRTEAALVMRELGLDE